MASCHKAGYSIFNTFTCRDIDVTVRAPGNDVYCTNASAVGRLCASISAVNVIPGCPGIKMSIPEFLGMKKGVRECIPYWYSACCCMR